MYVRHVRLYATEDVNLLCECQVHTGSPQCPNKQSLGLILSSPGQSARIYGDEGTISTMQPLSDVTQERAH